MNHRKGISELISAFAEVSARVPEAHLYLVGNGPDRAAFEAQAAASKYTGHIHFEGFQSDPIPYMKAAHTFVLASRRDSFGLVLTEARACDCAIVATDVDGIPEALDGGEAGLLVRPGDSGALAGAILKLLEKPEEHARLKMRARVNLERFSVERMAAQITNVYEELLTGWLRPASLSTRAIDTPEHSNRQHSENENVALNATGAGQ
jgi:glycosyltransferase involved in cell wall biosynthesis